MVNQNDLIDKEWELSWGQIKTISQIYWKLFLSILSLNGATGIYYLGKNINDIGIRDGIFSLFLLIINSLMILIHQKENYLQIKRIRKYILGREKELVKWNYYYNFDRVILQGHGYTLYQSLQILIGLIVPSFILYIYYISSIYRCSCNIFILFIIILLIVIVRYLYVHSITESELEIRRKEY